jgi:hypothetical protein
MTKEQAKILWRIANKSSEFVKAYQCIMSDAPLQDASPSDLPYPWSSFEAERERWNEFISQWNRVCQEGE